MLKCVIVVDTLSFFSLIPIAFRFRGVRSIFYLHKTRGILDRIFVNALGQRGWLFEQIQYSLSPVDGVSPYRELGRLCMEKIKACREEILSKHINALKSISEYERIRLSAYLGRLVGSEIYFALQTLVILNTKFPHRENIAAVFLRKSVFSGLLASAYKENNLTTYFYFSNKSFLERENFIFDRVILRDTASRLRNLLIIPLLFCYSLLCKIIYYLVLARKQIKKHKICALVANRSATELSSCLPWVSQGEHSLKRDILILYPNNFSKKAIEFYARRSDRCLRYSFNPFIAHKDMELIKAWAFYADFFLKNIRAYKKLLGLRGVKGWMFKYLADILTYLSFFEALFWANGSKVLWVMNEDDSVAQMAAMAANRQGGASLGTTWSQVPSPEWRIQHNHNDIYFAWGKRLAEVKAYDLCEFFVVAGYPADAAFHDEFKKARDFRSSILRKYKAKNILVFFDNVSGNDLPVTPEDTFRIYKEVFAWLEDDPLNFFIIKAKRSNPLNKFPLLEEKAGWFSKNGRMLILYDKGIIYPGLAADAVIGATLTLPSLAAVLGCPTIFYDIHNVARDYPLGLPNLHIISNACQIRQAIKNIIIEENNIPVHLEGLQAIKGSSIDPFVDGLSSERISGYMENLLRRFDAGFLNTEAIAFANAEHKKRWGENTVMAGPLQVEA